DSRLRPPENPRGTPVEPRAARRDLGSVPRRIPGGRRWSRARRGVIWAGSAERGPVVDLLLLGVEGIDLGGLVEAAHRELHLLGLHQLVHLPPQAPPPPHAPALPPPLPPHP